MRDTLLAADPATRKSIQDMLIALPKSVHFTEKAVQGDEEGKEAAGSPEKLAERFNDLTEKYMEEHKDIDIKDAQKAVLKANPDLQKYEDSLWS